MGLAYMSIPFLMIIGGGKIKDWISPMDWGIYAKVGKVDAAYRNTWARLVKHSEAIAVLKGNFTSNQENLRSHFLF